MSAEKHGGVDNPYETVKVIEAWGFNKNFNLASVISKVRTFDDNGDNVQKLKDARWYLDCEIARLEGIPSPNQNDLFNSIENGKKI